MIAGMSASMWPLAIFSSAARCGIAARPDLAAVGPVGAVGDQIDAELALRRLDRGVGLAGRHMKAFGVKLEVMDERFHRPLELGPLGRGDLLILELDRSLGHPIEALGHDLERLAHLGHAHHVAIEAVAVAADRDVEVELLVDLVGLALAQIPREPGGAQHGPGEAQVLRLVGGDHADVDQPLAEDPVVGDQPLDVVEQRREGRHPGPDVVLEPGRQVARDPARAVVVGVQAGARHPLVELHQLLALLEAPEQGRHGPDVERQRGDVEEMVEDAGDLVVQHPDPFGPLRDLDPEQVLDREHVGVLLGERRDVVEAVEVADALDVGPVLDQLLGAAMQQADVRVGALDDLAVELEHEAQHAVRGRMLGPEVQGVVLEGEVGHRLAPNQPAPPAPSAAFSSPGSTPPPSQGLRKSKLRQSWRRLTGS